VQKLHNSQQAAVQLIYKIFQSNLNEKEYGIAVYENDTLISKFSGIFSEKNEAEKVTSILNELKPEPCHLTDVLEDYLTYFSID
jgi:hypothetical protein